MGYLESYLLSLFLRTLLISVILFVLVKIRDKKIPAMPELQQDAESVHLRYSKRMRWIGFLCTVFFCICISVALQAHFERPDQEWAFISFIPFALLCLYAFADSYSEVVVLKNKIFSRDLFQGMRICSFNDIKDYKYNFLTRRLSVSFSSGNKLDISEYMNEYDLFIRRLHEERPL